MKLGDVLAINDDQNAISETVAQAKPRRLTLLRDTIIIWAKSHYFRQLRKFVRFLIRVIFWRRKEQDEDDYVHAGKVMAFGSIPVRSSKADGKRAALDYARTRTGNPRLTWGQARKRLQRWEREERADHAPRTLGTHRTGRDARARDGRVAAVAGGGSHGGR